VLQALADNGGPTRTMAIPLTSPAFDAGLGCPTIDQRGTARPQGAACDLGAFELVAALSVDRSLVEVGDPDRTIVVGGAGFDATSVVQVGGVDRPAPATLTIGVRGPGSQLAPTTVRVVTSLYQLHLPIVRR
jgi:hypothetical protein